MAGIGDYGCGWKSGRPLVFAITPTEPLWVVTEPGPAQHANDFFIYPDYYMVHVGQSFDNYSMLDISPAHKEVVAGDDLATLLQPINEGAITRHLLENGEPGRPVFQPATLASGRLVTALAYRPNGKVGEAGIAACGNEVAGAYVSAALEQSPKIDPDERVTIRVQHAELVHRGRPVESYRRIILDDARVLLAAVRSTTSTTSVGFLRR